MVKQVYQRIAISCLTAALVSGGSSASRAEVSIGEPSRVTCAVGGEGRGHVEASKAWRTLVTAEAAQLPQILAARDGANDLAVNWLRSAVETIAAKAMQSGGRPP